MRSSASGSLPSFGPPACLAILPKVELPPDIHPLPDDISAYFVYPYSLETHVLQPQPPHISHAERLAVQAEQHAKRVEFLKRREAEKARRKREQLRKVAPGWEPPEEDGDGGDPSSGASADPSSTRRQSGILEPTRKHTTMRTSSVTVLERPPSQPSSQQPRDVMDDLVEGLAKLDQLRVDDAGGA